MLLLLLFAVLYSPEWPELLHPLASAIDTPLPVAPEQVSSSCIMESFQDAVSELLHLIQLSDGTSAVESAAKIASILTGYSITIPVSESMARRSGTRNSVSPVGCIVMLPTRQILC